MHTSTSIYIKVVRTEALGADVDDVLLRLLVLEDNDSS